jgi:hypothetical protein
MYFCGIPFSFFLSFLICKSVNAEDEQGLLFNPVHVYQRELVRNQMLDNYRAEEEVEILSSVILLLNITVYICLSLIFSHIFRGEI